jgi:hypothetical protein
MAKLSIEDIKARFETGDRPTGEDYANLIDTLISQATDLGTSGNNEHTVYGIENRTTLETIDAKDWRMVKYIVSISKIDSGDNKFYATELSVLIDGTDLNVSEYAVIDNDGDIGTVDVSRDGDVLTLSVVPNPQVRPITVRYARMGLKA